MYVLKDCTGKVFVGKSADIKRRVDKHKIGEGSVITQGTTFLGEGIRQVVPITSGSTDDLEFWERNETLAQMRRQGLGRVQGWMFAGAVDTDC